MKYFIFTFFIFLLGCGDYISEEEDQSDLHNGIKYLIGGTKAASGLFPATVKIFLYEKIPPNKNVFVFTAVKISDFLFLTAAIPKMCKYVYIYPAGNIDEYKGIPIIKRLVPYKIKALFKNNSSDLGILELYEETPEIGVAKFNFDPIQGGEEVVIQGAGCHSKTEIKIFNESLNLPNNDLYFAWTKVIAEKAELTSEKIFSTSTETKKGEESLLCSEDKGGPIYKKIGEEFYIVGINLIALNSETSKINLHFSISSTGVKEWLSQALANKLEPSESDIEKEAEACMMHHNNFSFYGMFFLFFLIIFKLLKPGKSRKKLKFYKS